MEKRDYLLKKIAQDHPFQEFPYTDTIERLLDLLYLQQENFDEIWFKIHQLLEKHPIKTLPLIYTIIVSEEIDNRDQKYQSIQDIPHTEYGEKISRIKQRIQRTRIHAIPRDGDDAEMLRLIVKQESLKPIWLNKE